MHIKSKASFLSRVWTQRVVITPTRFRFSFRSLRSCKKNSSSNPAAQNNPQRTQPAVYDYMPGEESYIKTIATLEKTRQPSEAITFRSPVSGYVLEKQALKGMHVTPGQTLYKVANLSVVWVEADVYEQEMALARVGQRAKVTLDAYPGESFDGRAIYIYDIASRRTVGRFAVVEE